MSEIFNISWIMKFTDQTTGPLNALGETLDNLNKKFSEGGKVGMDFGKKMTAFATVPILGWAGYAIHKAEEIKIAFREMNEALDYLPADKRTGLQERLRRSSVELATPMKQIAEYVQMAGQMHMKDPEMFAKLAAQYSIASKSMKDPAAMDNLMHMALAVGMTEKQFKSFGDATIMLEEKYGTSAAAIIQQTRDLAGSIKLTAPMFERLAVSAFTTKVGTADMPIKRLLEGMFQASAGRDMQKLSTLSFLAGFGENQGARFQKLYENNPAVALSKVLQGLQNTKASDWEKLVRMGVLELAGVKTVGAIRELGASLGLFENIIKDLKDPLTVNDMILKKFNERLTDTDMKMTTLKITFDDVANKMGGHPREVFGWFLDWAGKMLVAVSQLPHWVTDLATGLLAVVAAIGPMVLLGAGMKGILTMLGFQGAIAATSIGALALSMSLLLADVLLIINAWRLWQENKNAIMQPGLLKDLGQWAVNDFGHALDLLSSHPDQKTNWFERGEVSAMGGAQGTPGSVSLNVGLIPGMKIISTTTNTQMTVNDMLNNGNRELSKRK